MLFSNNFLMIYGQEMLAECHLCHGQHVRGKKRLLGTAQLYLKSSLSLERVPRDLLPLKH